MTIYVIYITNEHGNRVCVKNAAYKNYDNACAAAAKLNAENPACEAEVVKVMRKMSRIPQIVG